MNRTLHRHTHLKHRLKFCTCSLKSFGISRVDNKENRISVWVVAPPVGTNTALTTKIPYLEFDVLVLKCLNVESDCGNCCYGFVDLQAVCCKKQM
jgi:hypothetical protein